MKKRKLLGLILLVSVLASMFAMMVYTVGLAYAIEIVFIAMLLMGLIGLSFYLMED